MGYERNDRRYGNSGDRNYGGDRGRYSGGQDYGRDDPASRGGYGSYGGGQREGRGGRFDDRSDYGRQPQGYDYQDRGFFDRAGDEVRSWFGDEEAERRRRQDERYDDQYRDDYPSRDYRSSGSANAGAGGYGNRGRSSDYGQSSNRNPNHDPSYSSWRDRQMAAFDSDYDEYRREHQSKFDNEFGTWRQGRQGQRDLLGKVREHQEVVGSDGQHVGKVDHVRGDRIQLTKNDQDAGGHHHTIPSSWITAVDEKVTINKTADQAKQQWREDQRSDSPFGSRDQQGGDRNLNRSFSGTY